MAEGAGLLNRYTVKSRIGGSNPPLSATPSLPDLDMSNAATVPDIPALPQRGERIHALDNLRAVAMLLGIVLHEALSFITLPVPWIARDVSNSRAFDLMVAVIHGCRMQIFFFLAGFFGHLLWCRLGARDFLKQRWKRIGVPFLLGMITLVPLVLALWAWGERQAEIPPAGTQYGELTLFSIPTSHLWFLEMLMLFYAGAALVAWGGEKLNLAGWLPRLDAMFDWFMAQPAKPLMLVPPTVLCLWNGPMLGEVDDAGLRLLPAMRAVFYYGLFFTVGWWLHRRRHQLDALRRWLKTYFTFAALALATLAVCYLAQIEHADARSPQIKLLALTAAALYAWLMTFAVTGWFLRFGGQHCPWMRYLAESSYWCYLAHLPLVAWLQVITAKWPLPAVVKFPGILLVTMMLLLASYHWGVRETWIGRMLNGPRKKPLPGTRP